VAHAHTHQHTQEFNTREVDLNKDAFGQAYLAGPAALAVLPVAAGSYLLVYCMRTSQLHVWGEIIHHPNPYYLLLTHADTLMYAYMYESGECPQ